jgi:hypothetical protein
MEKWTPLGYWVGVSHTSTATQHALSSMMSGRLFLCIVFSQQYACHLSDLLMSIAFLPPYFLWRPHGPTRSSPGRLTQLSTALTPAYLVLLSGYHLCALLALAISPSRRGAG